MSFVDFLPILAISAFIWAEIRGTEEQQKVVLVAAFAAVAVWALAR